MAYSGPRDNKAADQTARKSVLICTFVVCSAISRFSHDEDIVHLAQGADIKMQPNLHILKWTTLQQFNYSFAVW